MITAGAIWRPAVQFAAHQVAKKVLVAPPPRQTLLLLLANLLRMGTRRLERRLKRGGFPWRASGWTC